VPEDLQDKILAAMKGRKMSQNASYFAFTATPKPATLEKFGRQGPDGSSTLPPVLHEAGHRGEIHPRRAGEVHDLQELLRGQKSVEENPLFDTAKAQKKLKAFVEASPAPSR
jgi:type I restriction enzyme R subunit